MKSKTRVFGLVLCGLLLFSTCDLFLRTQAPGDMRIEFDLTQPRQLGYEVNRVHCTLTHQSSGKVVERDLGIEGETASGVVRGLRVGKWAR